MGVRRKIQMWLFSNLSGESLGVAIITGSAIGIGEAIALKLAEDGYNIVLNDLPVNQTALASVANKIGEKGRKAVAIVGDVSAESDVKNLVEKTVYELGRVDVMVANAGVTQVGPFLETTVTDFEKLFAVNVRGTYLCFKYAAEQMIKQGYGGRLIAASSTAGLSGRPLISLYSSTKYAIRGLVTSTAKELGKHGITVNAYAPGPIQGTEMYADVKEKVARIHGFQDLKAFDEMQKQSTVLGYIGKVEDVANVVSFLAKKESHFITGQTVSVNGGTFVQ